MIIVERSRKNLDGRIAAFVSGGVDSMVMLDMLVQQNTDVFVVHVNHKIRVEADDDCAFVQSTCKRLGIKFVLYTFDIPSMASSSGRSIETEARLARRAVADELIKNGLADKVAFAHHADDNAETVLMHIFRGAGVDGLKGITQNDKIIRPLLSFTREQIEAYAQQNDISFVQDKTNYDTAYTRNFIRHEVLPLIKTRYPAVVQTLNRLAENVTQTVAALDSQLDYSLIKVNDDEVELALSALNTPFADRYVISATKILMPVDVTRTQIQAVLSLKDSPNGSKAELSGNLKAYKQYEHIVFCFDKPRLDFCVPFSVGETKIANVNILVKNVEPCVIKGKTIIDSSIPIGCVFRRRKEGDKFVPYGGASKSLKKYLIDKKIPRRIRDELVCLCAENEVLAIVGVEISDKCKISEQSKSAYLLEVDYE